MTILCCKFLLIILLYSVNVSLLFARNASLDDSWTAYKKLYKKVYDGDEEERRSCWELCLEVVSKHNLGTDNGTYTFRTAINEFSDMDHDTFIKHFCGYKISHRNKTYTSLTATNVATAIDWREYGYVSKVKNQNQCGACWAFSATGSLESQVKKNTGKDVLLSEQNLIDCSKGDDKGCEGGSIADAFQYIIKNGGIDTASSYDYEAKEGKCRFSKCDIGATCSKFIFTHSGDENELKVAVGSIGPVSIGIDASQPEFQLYSSGIYTEPKCHPKRLNHAVLIVGYGVEDGVDYWLIKNSWGTSWGDKGYMKIARNKNNMCGIATQALYPII